MTASQEKRSRTRSRAGLAQAPPQARVGEQALERGAQRGHVAGRNEHAGLAVDDEVEQAADRARDDRAAVRHRLGADDAEPFAARGHATTAARP